MELLGNWEKNEAEEQNRKKYQEQDSSIAVLNTRRCSRIEQVRDGGDGNQGTQPESLIGGGGKAYGLMG